ncbi:ABC transporter permease [Naasia sp. SYSU D00057]|uniref:ABC transporter permease n=1 Tax=Naasia sp. SYSU D00057 TaxID=2817380 RepID=UPI001B301BDC|nr:ABC transporter permease subunit [Naasia sp. SYSU D00057]
MSSTATVARRELVALRRDRLLVVLLGFLAAVTLVSVIVGAAAFRAQLEAYQLYVQQLEQSGSSTRAAAPRLFPLQLLRGSVEYVEILGALFAIVLGYGAVATEKYRGTLPLLLSRPVGRFALPLGKLAGIAGIWLAVVVALTVLWTAAIVGIGSASLGPADLGRILIVGAFSWLYLVFWSALAVALTAVTSRLSLGLILAIVIWLTFVLIIPQLGDTMDPDNQVPGGLFKALEIDSSSEAAVIAHFATFEELRNFLESASPTKHFERLAFAFLGIDDDFNQKPIGVVWSGIWGYAVAIAAAGVAAVAAAALVTTRSNLQRTRS